MLADDCISGDCIRRNNRRGTEGVKIGSQRTRGHVFVRGDSVAVETEWQSCVLSPFLVVLSHSKSHGFYSVPGSSFFYVTPR